MTLTTRSSSGLAWLCSSIGHPVAERGQLGCCCWSNSISRCTKLAANSLLLKVTEDLRPPWHPSDAVAPRAGAVPIQKQPQFTSTGEFIRDGRCPARRLGAEPHALTNKILWTAPLQARSPLLDLHSRHRRSGAAWTTAFVVSPTADRQYRSKLVFGAYWLATPGWDGNMGACFAARAQSIRGRQGPLPRASTTSRAVSCTPSRGIYFAAGLSAIRIGLDSTILLDRPRRLMQGSGRDRPDRARGAVSSLGGYSAAIISWPAAAGDGTASVGSARS